jgi:hypothetical protein
MLVEVVQASLIYWTASPHQSDPVAILVHRHRAGEVQDRDDEPRLQHPSAGSARADGACARLSALTGGVRVSCKRPARRQSGPRSGGPTLARAPQPLAQPKRGIVRGPHKSVLHTARSLGYPGGALAFLGWCSLKMQSVELLQERKPRTSLARSTASSRPHPVIAGVLIFSVEFFQKRGPHKVGDANKFMPRCPLNFEEHGVRYAGLDRSAVGSRKYFTALALSKGVGLPFSGHIPSIIPRRPARDPTHTRHVFYPGLSMILDQYQAQDEAQDGKCWWTRIATGSAW